MSTNNFNPDLSDRRVAVLGAGLTGMAVAEFLVKRGASVFVSEAGSISAKAKTHLTQLGIEFEEGGHSANVFEAEMIVPSPGVPASSKVLLDARSIMMPVIGDIELASMFVDSSRVIAVTGTVGKTTTTHLISEILKAHGHNVITAGNIGVPWVSQIDSATADAIHVIEVSSYQLEHVARFAPHIGVFTKFSPHHLGRHETLESYLEIKSRLFAHQTESDYAVIQHENTVPKRLKSQILEFCADDAGVQGLSLNEHLKENLSAALSATRCLDASVSVDKLDLAQFLTLEHRIEDLGTVSETRFYNDSKATTPQATIAALKSFEGQGVVLILGGSNTEPDLEPLLEEIMTQNTRHVLLIGESSMKLSLAFNNNNFERYERVSSLSEAIERALQLAPEVCLFSPAAPSFDQFSSYVERGQTFKKVLSSYRTKTLVTHPSDQQLPGSLQ